MYKGISQRDQNIRFHVTDETQSRSQNVTQVEEGVSKSAHPRPITHSLEKNNIEILSCIVSYL